MDKVVTFHLLDGNTIQVITDNVPNAMYWFYDAYPGYKFKSVTWKYADDIKKIDMHNVITFHRSNGDTIRVLIDKVPNAR